MPEPDIDPEVREYGAFECPRCSAVVMNVDAHRTWHDEVTKYVGELVFELGKLDQRLGLQLAAILARLGGAPTLVHNTPSDLPGHSSG